MRVTLVITGETGLFGLHCLAVLRDSQKFDVKTWLLKILQKF